MPNLVRILTIPDSDPGQAGAAGPGPGSAGQGGGTGPDRAAVGRGPDRAADRMAGPPPPSVGGQGVVAAYPGVPTDGGRGAPARRHHDGTSTTGGTSTYFAPRRPRPPRRS